MKQINDISTLAEKLEVKVDHLLKSAKTITKKRVENLNDKVSILNEIRASIYEDLNQLQHEHLLINALRWLIANNNAPSTCEWSWNPSSTGIAEEPDLQAVNQNKVILSAEATTSSAPMGSLDKRMKSTLTNLSKMKGELYYFVVTEEMAQRANTKIGKMAGVNIKVVVLSHTGKPY